MFKSMFDILYSSYLYNLLSISEIQFVVSHFGGSSLLREDRVKSPKVSQLFRAFYQVS